MRKVESKPWRTFFFGVAGTAGGLIAVLFGFVAIVDPLNILPLSPRLDRGLATSNQRFSYAALARSPRFDSAIFGRSTAQLLRPEVLDATLHGRFVNLSILAATAYEQTRIMRVFVETHPETRWIVVGLDGEWCRTGNTIPKLTFRPFPEWMYERDTWHGYREALNLSMIELAGKQFALLTGLKKEEFSREGYQPFVPPDDRYDPARAAARLREQGPEEPSGTRDGPAASWRFPTFAWLSDVLAAKPPRARVILFFVPYHRSLQPPDDSVGGAAWTACKRHAVAFARQQNGVFVVDFMRPSPITRDDEAYWDPHHYRIGIADRIVQDLAAAAVGEPSMDYEILSPP